MPNSYILLYTHRHIYTCPGLVNNHVINNYEVKCITTALRRTYSAPSKAECPPKWIEMVVNSYPLLLWVHVTNAKVVLLQQTVVVADVVNKKLPFGLPLQKKHSYVSVRACLVHSCLTCASFTPIGLHVQKSIHSFQSLEQGFQTLECNPQWEIHLHTVSHFTHTHTHTHTHMKPKGNQKRNQKNTKQCPA